MGDDQGFVVPLGVSWVADKNASNLALYWRFAESVTRLLYGASEFATPLFECLLDPLRNKSGRIWHCQVPKRALPDATD